MGTPRKTNVKKPKSGFADPKNRKNINRKGRPPKGHSIAERMRDFLIMTGHQVKFEEKIAGPELDGMDRLDLLVRAIFHSALSGSSGAMRIIRDSVDGLPIQTIRTIGEKTGLKVTFENVGSEDDGKDPNIEMSLGKTDAEKEAGTTPSKP